MVIVIENGHGDMSLDDAACISRSPNILEKVRI